MRRRTNRRKTGAHLVEYAAVLMIGLPLLVLLIFVTLECTRFFTIKSAMELGARNAARALVVDYNKTGTKGTSLSWLRMPKFIQYDDQFIVDWDTANNPPKFVTVTCQYNGDNSHPLLPKFPGGPLRYLTNSARWDLSAITVRGTFTVPVQ